VNLGKRLGYVAEFRNDQLAVPDSSGTLVYDDLEGRSKTQQTNGVLEFSIVFMPSICYSDLWNNLTRPLPRLFGEPD
jgi:hypothetical protein